MLEFELTQLLRSIDIPTDQTTVAPVAHGFNNRNYYVTARKHTFLLKHYFSHPDDPRNRLKAEWAFSNYAYSVAPTFVPKPIVCDSSAQVALFDFVQGQRLVSADITQQLVDQAAQFFCLLNTSDRKKVVNVSNASEACFSLAEHIACVDFRMKQLESCHTHLDDCVDFKEILDQMNDQWQQIKHKIMHHALYHQHNAIRHDQYCMSPSDFGFHNALKKPDQQMIFLDFEYAGWDDPAKMACDFFSQIAIPVPATYFNHFLSQVMSVFPQADQLIERAIVLKPLYFIKWCCIVLNVFLPHHLSRKCFANSTVDITLLQRQQLGKARKMLDALYARN
jgi:hypothetical protein